MSKRGADRSDTWRPHFKALLAGGPQPCSKCGKPVTVEMDWHVDHLTNYVDGGRATADNLWVAHAVCNLRAGQARGQASIRAKKNLDERLLKW